MLKEGDKAIDIQNGNKVEIVDVRRSNIVIAGEMVEYGCKYLTGPEQGQVRYLPISRVKI